MRLAKRNRNIQIKATDEEMQMMHVLAFKADIGVSTLIRSWIKANYHMIASQPQFYGKSVDEVLKIVIEG